MQQQQRLGHQATSQTTSIDPIPLLQSDSPTALILSISILLSTLLGGITGLVKEIRERDHGK